MKTITIADQATGRILRVQSLPDQFDAFVDGATETAIEEQSNIYSDYILNGEITARPTQATSLSKAEINANGSDSVAILNAPIGATCTITSADGTVIAEGPIDGSDSFTSDDSGLYHIVVTLFPYLDWEGTINAI